MQATIESNRQDSDEKMKKLTEYLTQMITSMMYQIKILKSSPDNKDSPKYQNPTTVVPDKKKDPSLEGGYYTKIGVIWTLKHEIISPKLYDLLINIELKGDTDMDLKNFYNHINMYLNMVTRPREELLPAYHSIIMHFEFE